MTGYGKEPVSATKTSSQSFTVVINQQGDTSVNEDVHHSDSDHSESSSDEGSSNHDDEPEDHQPEDDD